MDRKDLNVMKREQRTGKERQENQMVETEKERLEGFKGGEEMKGGKTEESHERVGDEEKGEM